MTISSIEAELARERAKSALLLKVVAAGGGGCPDDPMPGCPEASDCVACWGAWASKEAWNASSVQGAPLCPS